MGKSALGRGLKALIPTMDDEPEKGVEIKSDKIKSDSGGLNIIAKIDISKIDTNPFQPRINFDPVSLQELKQSIIEKGIIQPITVRRKGSERYELISGERRIRASLEAGLTQIPAYIIDLTNRKELLELALVENIQREHLGPIEMATAFQRLIDEYGYSHEEIAKRVGKDRTTITNFIRLLKLPDKVKESLDKNEITVGHARALINLPRVSDQVNIWHDILKNGLSVRKVEKIVQSYVDGKKNKGGNARKESKNIDDKSSEYVVSKIRNILGTKVQVEKDKNNGMGKIYIEFYSEDDLNRLLELFESIQNKQA
jgi:ParB family transcriptional regulator, chromosome partitioning protein